MAQKQSPFIEGNYGWDLGESGWNVGMDENLLKFSYLFDSNIDGIVATLPTAVTGQAYFNTTDQHVYFAVDNSWCSSPVPLWHIFKLRTTGDCYQFNGTALVHVETSTQLSADITSLNTTVVGIGSTLGSLGSAAFQPATSFATPASVTGAIGTANNYTDGKVAAIDTTTPSNNLRSDIALATGTSKGAYQVGWSGRTVGARLSEIVNVADVKAANPSFTWNQVFDAAQNLLPSDPLNVGRRAGTVFIPPGDYLITGVAKKAGVIFQGCGTSTRIYNNNTTTYCFTSANTGGIQDLGGFRDLIFDGGDPTSTSGASRIGFGGINNAAMHAAFVENCIFQRFAGRAISNQNVLSVKFGIYGCYFTGNAMAIAMADGKSTALHIDESYFAFNDYGLLLTGQSDFHICNTIVEQNYLIGLRVDGTIDQGTIDNCYFEQNGAGVGGMKFNMLIYSGKSISIRGTLFNMLGSAAGSSGSGWGHIFCGDLDNLSISNCTLNSGAGITGFSLQGASGGSKSISVQGVTTYAGASLAFADNLATPRLAFGSAKVPVPATSVTAGQVGQWAADAFAAYFYMGDGVTHNWRKVATTTF